MKPSIVHGRRSAQSFANPVKMTAADVQHAASLRGIGINFDNEWIADVMRANGVSFAVDGNDVAPMSAATGTLTTPSIAAQIQFLQNWLPGYVVVATAARNIDRLIGMQTVGSWEDAEIVQGVLEHIGNAQPYSDNANVPLANWNANFERRSVVQFELGFSVAMLEEARAARMRLSTAEAKRKGVQIALDIQRNRVGFYGFNSGDNRTYGFLNDPALPAYQSVQPGAGGATQWSTKTFLEITRDLRNILATLRKNSKDVIDPKNTKITFAIATAAVDYLTTTSDFGVSVLDWLRTNYPNVRVESAPELDDANGGASVIYAYADKIDDGSTDDSSVFAQIVPSILYTLGVEKRSKSYIEDFSNATAGTLCKRPYAVIRMTGI